ncbi:unnamed protein product [Adineta ricciae]|uniref:C2H2-type domain-containing protein n=1 Tax=Adineta ricciae TaxID=249248 RepID=A0A813WTS5_ADIRI|nr:unnamed protein product [Adineta ricciae]
MNSASSDSVETSSSRVNNIYSALPDTSNVIRASSNSTVDQLTTKSNRYFSCTICNIELSNQKLFNSHLNSQQHQQAQSIHDVLQSVAPEYRSAYKAMFSPEMLNKKVFNRELLCEEQIKQTREPLLGLNYIIEFQFENTPNSAQYICDLCRCKCSFQSILPHITNIQHQRKFLKIHHPDMYERVLTASTIRSEQQRLIENYAKQIQSRYGGPGTIQLHVQLNSFVGQRPVVLAVIYKSSTDQYTKVQQKPVIQLASKTFEEFDYRYENELDGSRVNAAKIEYEATRTSELTETTCQDSIQRGLSPEDLLYPFDRQFWYQNYKDLLESRPIDPHSVTYQEVISDTNKIPPFLNITENTRTSPVPINMNENCATLENGQTIRRNTSQPSNRRVILDTNRTPTLTNTGTLRISPTKPRPNFDGYTLLNEQQKKTNGTSAVLNEQSARAILAASGLLQSDEEDEYNMDRLHSSSNKTREELKKKSERVVSPAIAKRMLDAVLTGDLDVAHIQPYFSTFVDLIQSGQVELERHQAERLLHKVLVTSSSSCGSPKIKSEPTTDSNKRPRSTSSTREHRSLSSSTRYRRYPDDYRSSTETNSNKYSTSSMTRRVHLTNENKTMNGKQSSQ